MRQRLTTVWILSVVLYLFSAAIGNAAASDKYKVIADSLNVRNEPSLKAAVVGSLRNGAVVSVTKESHGWYQVKADAVSGWVAGYYLKKADSVETASATVPPSAEPLPADGPKPEEPAASEQPKSGEPAPGGSKPDEAGGSPKDAEAGADAKPDAGTDKGTDKSAEESSKQAGQLAVGGAAYVSADALRVRVGPGTGHKIAGTVYYGAELTVLESGEEWVKVRTAAGLTGWVSVQYASAEAPGKAPARQAGPLSGRIIAIDPGHGGNDPGMIGVKHKTYEKDLNLATSGYLAEELERLGAKVVMTRTKDDEKPELSARVRIAEEADADAFVSVHYNSSPNKASGTLTFYYSEQDDRQLARAIERELAAGIGLKSNGISYGNFHVLRENDVPAALVELGFLTNEKDEELVRTEEYQRAAAAAIAQGLITYLTT